MRNTTALPVSYGIALAIYGGMPKNRKVFDMLSFLAMWAFPRGGACRV